MSELLLLSCYELGHQPLSLAWPLAFLRRAGIHAETVDLAVEPFPKERVARARLVAISVPMHTALRLGIQVARRVRELQPGAHVACFGAYAWLNADLLLHGIADSVLAGESEEALVALARAVLAGELPQDVRISTPGRRGAPVRERLSFPVPERSGLPPLERYARFLAGGRRELAGYLEASRGCKHTCLHCPIVPVYEGRFFAVPVETVLADARAQVAAGARHLSFGDPDFLNGPTHALRVVRALHAELPGISFDFTAKVEHLLRQRALLPELRERGCAFVVSAVESLSDEALRRLRKGHSAADVAELCDLLEAAGIALHPTLVAFTPWTTLGDYLAALDFFRARGLCAAVPPVQAAIRLLVPPGSALLSDPGTAGCFGPLDAAGLGHEWRHPDARMDALHDAVSLAVAEDEQAGRPAALTWAKVRALARRAAGLAEDETEPPSFRPEPPRLSEHWFC